MLLEFHKPSPPLCNYAEAFTFYKDLNHTHTIERLLPDGTTNLIIELEDISNYLYDNATLAKQQRFKHAWISGMQKEFISISASPKSSMFVIQFRPGGLYPFINMPMNELNDLVIDADLLFGNDIFSLREQLLNAPYPFQKFFYAEQWLLRRLTEYSFSKQVLEFAIKEICQHPTNDSIAMIAHKTGYSQRQFIHLFKKFVGLKPKYFQRIQRFNKVLEELETCKEINWTAISHDCGFYDQAHFIREFKKFSGFNPSDYLCEKGVYVNYVPVS